MYKFLTETKAAVRTRHLPHIAEWSCRRAILKVQKVSRQSSYVDKLPDTNNFITGAHKSLKKLPETSVITELNATPPVTQTLQTSNRKSMKLKTLKIKRITIKNT